MGCVWVERAALKWFFLICKATKSICNYGFILLVKLFSFLFSCDMFSVSFTQRHVLRIKCSEITSHIIHNSLIVRRNWDEKTMIIIIKCKSSSSLFCSSMKTLTKYPKTKCWRGHTLNSNPCQTTFCLFHCQT